MANPQGVPKTDEEVRDRYFAFCAKAGVEDHERDRINRKWKSIGRIAAQPASLRGTPEVHG